MVHEKKIIAKTDRLILRRYGNEDLQDLYEYLSDEEVVKYEPYRVMDIAEVSEELDRRISSNEMIAVVLKETNKLIGNLYVGRRAFDSLELGYAFNRQFWGQGYAKESCEALMKRAFLEGTHRIFAECDPCNTGSWRLLESLGFVREAYFKHNVSIWKDTFVYSLLKE